MPTVPSDTLYHINRSHKCMSDVDDIYLSNKYSSGLCQDGVCTMLRHQAIANASQISSLFFFFFPKRNVTKFSMCLSMSSSIRTSAAFRRKFTSGAHHLWVRIYQWKVLSILNNSSPVCLCVYVNKHKWQRERNKRNHNISLSAMQMMHISFVKSFPMLFIKIQRTKTLYLTCFL